MRNTVLAMLAVTSISLWASLCVAQSQPGELSPMPAEGAGAPAGTSVQPVVTSQPENAPAPGPGKGLFGGDMTFFVVIIALFILFYWWMGRSNRKREATRKQMLANLKKGDKITTIGGLKGSVVEVREDEVLVKVDENVRMRFSRWAIRDVGEEKPEEKK